MTSRTTRTNAHRTALGLVGTVAALALTVGSVAAQDTGVDPEPNIEAPRITGGVAPLEGQTEASPAFTGYEAAILSLQRAASQGMIPAIAADAMIADIQARHEIDHTPRFTDLAARYGVDAAPAITGYEAMILDLQRAASRGMIPAIAADAMIADVQARYGVAPVSHRPRRDARGPFHRLTRYARTGPAVSAAWRSYATRRCGQSPSQSRNPKRGRRASVTVARLRRSRRSSLLSRRPPRRMSASLPATPAPASWTYTGTQLASRASIAPDQVTPLPSSLWTTSAIEARQ